MYRPSGWLKPRQVLPQWEMVRYCDRLLRPPSGTDFGSGLHGLQIILSMDMVSGQRSVRDIVGWDTDRCERGLRPPPVPPLLNTPLLP